MGKDLEAWTRASHTLLSTWPPGNFVTMLFLVQPFIKFPYDVGVSGHQRKIEKSKKIPAGVFLVFYR